MKSAITRSILLMAAVCTAAIAVSAQPWFIGPQFGYTIAVNTPEQVSQEGAPTRLVMGAMAVYEASPRMEIHLSALYRIENGGFASSYIAPVAGVGKPPTGGIGVVDPNVPSPSVISTVETASVEFMAGLHFPVAELDTAGSVLTLGLSALADYMLTGSQVDDYSKIPDYTGAQTQSFTYVPQMGFGAAIGFGMVLRMGRSDRLGFDLQYVIREPQEINAEQDGTQLPDPVNVSWLVGRGLRLSLSYGFAL